MTDQRWPFPMSMVLLAVGAVLLPDPIAATLIYLLSGLGMWTLGQHLRLHPWCPYCRWGGGGEKQAPVMGPLPSPGR